MCHVILAQAMTAEQASEHVRSDVLSKDIVELSVLTREAGDLAAAAARLDRAWAGIPHDALHRTEVDQCLLDGVVRSIEGDPRHALRLVAASSRLFGNASLGWGVEYHVEGILDRLRAPWVRQR